MSFHGALFSGLLHAIRKRWPSADARVMHESKAETTAQAVGDCLALLATIFEREGVVTTNELAKLLNEFAIVTAADRPQRGQLLMSWATRLEETAAALR